MSEFWKVTLGLGLGVVIYHYWDKRKSVESLNYTGKAKEKLPISHLEEIQKNVHLYLDQLTEGNVPEKEIEKIVLELVK